MQPRSGSVLFDLKAAPPPPAPAVSEAAVVPASAPPPPPAVSEAVVVELDDSTAAQSLKPKPSEVLLQSMPSDQFVEPSSPKARESLQSMSGHRSHELFGEDELDPPEFDQPALASAVWDVDVTEKFISEEIGYGIFAKRICPGEFFLTTYDGPRVDSATGRVLFECPHSLSVEKSFQEPHHVSWKRGEKWGPYERGHCLLMNRQSSQQSCIDGTFSSQPFLYEEPFHGGIGFGACLNSGRNPQVNNVELRWKPNSNLAGLDGIHPSLRQVQLYTQTQSHFMLPTSHGTRHASSQV